MNDSESLVCRSLTIDEIAALERQGCQCAEWSLVRVEEPFSSGCYRNVTFCGEVLLGAVGESCREVVSGIKRRCGIYNAVVADCVIGREVYIANVTGGLHNLDIDDGVVIDTIYSMICRGESCFGSDVKVNVLSETGGREVTISEYLTPSLAYITAFYRHSAMLSRALDEIADREAERRSNTRSHIGSEAVIVNCGEIENVEIRGGAVLRGVRHLVNGTVGKAFVGTGVIAEDFIIQDGAKVDNSVYLHGCLVGRCAEISSGFTAHDTLVFTNSRLENGESAAAFCGPFTTTMHKSTLLIGGLFSFFNAGSGTNQSNHLYKLGPMHQGILARGCKTGSESYIMWPAAVGAFTTVTGKHYSHPDTRLFPFSYLMEKKGRSVILPGASVGSVGLVRDVVKWPSRIGEEAVNDSVNFNWLSPYTIKSVIDGLRQLNLMSARDENRGGDDIEYNGAFVARRFLEKGVKRYSELIDIFTAGVIKRKIVALVSTMPEITPDLLLEKLREAPRQEGIGDWVDLCGLLAPREEVDNLVSEIISGGLSTTNDINQRLLRIHDNYRQYSWSWLWYNLPSLVGISFSTITMESLRKILTNGMNAAFSFEKRIVKDASKEFDPEKGGLGFGIDASNNYQEILDDFARVRGSLSSQRFLAQFHRNIQLYIGSIRSITATLANPD